MTTFGPMIGAAAMPAGAGSAFVIDLSPVAVAAAVVALVAVLLISWRRQVPSRTPRTASSAPAPLAA
jgi:hypothetical protein